MKAHRIALILFISALIFGSQTTAQAEANPQIGNTTTGEISKMLKKGYKPFLQCDHFKGQNLNLEEGKQDTKGLKGPGQIAR